MNEEFNKYPSTDDSAESLKHRPKSPLNRNWNWSPKAPGTHHVIESVNYKGDDHALGNVPHEIVEASENILPKNIEDSNPYKEREEFNKDEVSKRKRKADNEEDNDDDEDIVEYDLESDCEECKVSDEEEHAEAVCLGTQIILAAIQKARFDKLFGRN